MKQLAEDLYMLKGFPPNAINVYVAGDVLIDSATRQAEKRIFKQIADLKLTAHALTHVHPDHQGCSHVVCERLGIPLWVGQDDVPAMETAGSVVGGKAPAWLKRVQERYWVGPPHPVSRALREGDEVAGFVVLDTPGHTRGEVSFWRESDRVLILGERHLRVVLTDYQAHYNTARPHQGIAQHIPDPADLAAQHCVLVPEYQELGVLGHLAPGQHRQATQQTAYKQVGDRNDHSARIPARQPAQARSSNRAPQDARRANRQPSNAGRAGCPAEVIPSGRVGP